MFTGWRSLQLALCHGADTLDCRLACIDNRQSVGFSYVRAKKQCWLKGALGQAVRKQGVLTGVKSINTFSPANIISLR